MQSRKRPSQFGDQPLPSPCVGICKIDETRKFCTGCLRTITQISDWPTLDNKGRWEILQSLKQKRLDMGLRRPKPSDRTPRKN